MEKYLIVYILIHDTFEKDTGRACLPTQRYLMTGVSFAEIKV